MKTDISDRFWKFTDSNYCSHNAKPDPLEYKGNASTILATHFSFNE